jgi:hypothetical protein
VPFTPYDAATHAMGRARALLRESSPKQKRGSAPLRTDLRRLAVVMAVAALDTYMHRLVLERAFWGPELPPALARLDVRFDQLLAQADETAAAARNAPRNTRPRVGVKRQLRDRLLRETFQNFDDVSKALSMAGQSSKWGVIGKELNPPMSPEDIKRRLNGIVVRRNQIVHEGDYSRLERPQRATRNPMSPSDAAADVAFLGALIDAIHAAVSR